MNQRFLLVGLACLIACLQQPCWSHDWNGVRSWVYQLTNYKNDRLAEIIESDFDLAVVDIARDGGKDFFTRPEIEVLKECASQRLGAAQTCSARLRDLASTEWVPTGRV